MSDTKRPIGRPRIYTEQIANEICERIANGESLRAICTDSAMPSRETVRVWLLEMSDFSAQYARAREQQADHYVDEMIEIADNTLEDSAAVQKAKLRVDARKWAVEKLAPKKYGTNRHDVTSSDGSMTPKSAITPEQFAEIAKEIADKV